MFIGPTKLTKTDKVSYIKRGGSITSIWSYLLTKANAQGIGRRGSEWLSSKATNTSKR